MDFGKVKNSNEPIEINHKYEKKEYLIKIYDYNSFPANNQPVTSEIYEDADCLFCCFDLNQKQTLFNFTLKNTLEEKEDTSKLKILVGLKKDVRDLMLQAPEVQEDKVRKEEMVIPDYGKQVAQRN